MVPVWMTAVETDNASVSLFSKFVEDKLCAGQVVWAQGEAIERMQNESRDALKATISQIMLPIRMGIACTPGTPAVVGRQCGAAKVLCPGVQQCRGPARSGNKKAAAATGSPRRRA